MPATASANTGYNAQKATGVEPGFDSGLQRQQRERLRAEAMRKIQSAMASNDGITARDVEAYRSNVLSEHALERDGATTHEAKMQWLRQNVSTYIPQVVEDSKRLEVKFYNDINRARSAGWISTESANRWQQRLKSSAVVWWEKKVFLTEEFPRYLENWNALHKDWKQVEAKAKKLGLKASDLPELKLVLGSSFLKQSYDDRRVLVDNALAALGANDQEKKDLYNQAKAQLDGAVKSGALAPGKVSVWLRRIFESGASSQKIEQFLHGNGSTALSGLIAKWATVRRKFDDVETKRQRGLDAPGFNFVTTDKFLNWHYDQRLAYVEEADRRLKGAPTENVLLGDIRRELDMKDWDSAQHLINKALASNLSEHELKEVQSMQQYLRTQQRNTPQDAAVIESDTPEDDLYKALAEVQHVSPAMYSLYMKAAAKGAGTFSALSTLMYNRCWVTERGIWDESGELELRERAKDETRQIVREGHHRKYENNMIDGYGTDAIRDHKKGEWAPQVLHCSSDPGAQNALVEKCYANQNNHSFKYWSTLVPEGLSYERHRYLVYNVNWRVKSALRRMGGKAHNVNRASYERTKAARQSK